MSNGGEDGGTIRANREGFEHYQLRARRLVDVSKTDTVGHALRQDVGDADLPVPGQRPPDVQPARRAGHGASGEGEEASADALDDDDDAGRRGERGARRAGVVPALHAARLEQTRELVKRVEAAGCPALVFTVDLLGGRNTELFKRVQQRNQQAVRLVPQGQPADRSSPTGRW